MGLESLEKDLSMEIIDPWVPREWSFVDIRDAGEEQEVFIGMMETNRANNFTSPTCEFVCW